MSEGISSATPEKAGVITSIFMGAAATGGTLIVASTAIGMSLLGGAFTGGVVTAATESFALGVAGGGALAGGIVYGAYKLTRMGLRALFKNTVVSKPWAVVGGVGAVGLLMAVPESAVNIPTATPAVSAPSEETAPTTVPYRQPVLTHDFVAGVLKQNNLLPSSTQEREALIKKLQGVRSAPALTN